MKIATLFMILNRLLVIAGVLLLLTAASSCGNGKSNSEDDTFRQSIIDDPARAQSENEAAKIGKKKPADTTRNDSVKRR